MIFNISRTSDPFYDKVPFEGAKRVEKIKTYSHKIGYGFEKEYSIKHVRYTIEINTLEDLINLINQVDEDIVISRPFPNKDENYEIEIYDTYRE